MSISMTKKMENEVVSIGTGLLRLAFQYSVHV